jgi:dipeptidyl aminopeptidase/acylaminoacyl peptidase
MEDTHVWAMNADGSDRRELGKDIDNRQGAPEWSSDGKWVYFTLQDRGTVRLMRMPSGGGAAEPVVAERASVGSWSSASANVASLRDATSSAGQAVRLRRTASADGSARDTVAFALTAPESPAELHVKTPAGVRRLTALNRELLAGKAIALVEAFTFKSFDGTDIEAFITKPHTAPGSATASAVATGKHPMIVNIHGGPHGQQGPGFNAKAQIYAAQGWATLMVNYRGSTGYGQKLADAIFRDQNGGEAKDVLAGVDAALAKYPWIDANRLGIEGGSYGGQLTNWIVTQTSRFRAAIPAAGISNLVSFNYMAYYHDYLAVEFGAFPHEQNLMDLLWERSPIRYVHKVSTPTLFLHGENDNDVPIAEAEQFFIALMDVGVETQMVRYPREGHGIRETKHVADTIERSIAWYRKHFAATSNSSASR